MDSRDGMLCGWMADYYTCIRSYLHAVCLFDDCVCPDKDIRIHKL
jgi:hypothetical protein